MQVCQNVMSQFHQFLPNLHKTASMTSFNSQMTCQQAMDNTCSRQTMNEVFWKKSIKWIMRLRKKENISKSTLYLAVTYLIKIVLHSGCQMNESNYEKICVAVVLISTKMNEIYPPKISTLLSKCTKFFTKDELIQTQGQILKLFNYDMTFTETAYTHLLSILRNQTPDKIEDAEKLLCLALTQKKIVQNGEQILAMGIVYLIKPSLMREYGYDNIHEIKTSANKVYNLYIANRSKN